MSETPLSDLWDATEPDSWKRDLDQIKRWLHIPRSLAIAAWLLALAAWQYAREYTTAHRTALLWGVTASALAVAFGWEGIAVAVALYTTAYTARGL